jgi:hypothetical protein
MSRKSWHARGYHEWCCSTPVIDVAGTVVGVASVVIGAHAAIFLAIAISNSNGRLIFENSLFFVGILLANAFVDGLRHWRRHYG